MRPVEVKVFSISFTFLNSVNEKVRQSLPKYFTSRFELSYSKAKGASSVYDKLEKLRNLLNSTNLNESNQIKAKLNP